MYVAGKDVWNDMESSHKFLRDGRTSLRNDREISLKNKLSSDSPTALSRDYSMADQKTFRNLHSNSHILIPRPPSTISIYSSKSSESGDGRSSRIVRRDDSRLNNAHSNVDYVENFVSGENKAALAGFERQRVKSDTDDNRVSSSEPVMTKNERDRNKLGRLTLNTNGNLSNDIGQISGFVTSTSKIKDQKDRWEHVLEDSATYSINEKDRKQVGASNNANDEEINSHRSKSHFDFEEYIMDSMSPSNRFKARLRQFGLENSRESHHSARLGRALSSRPSSRSQRNRNLYLWSADTRQNSKTEGVLKESNRSKSAVIRTLGKATDDKYLHQYNIPKSPSVARSPSATLQLPYSGSYSRPLPVRSIRSASALGRPLSVSSLASYAKDDSEKNIEDDRSSLIIIGARKSKDAEILCSRANSLLEKKDMKSEKDEEKIKEESATSTQEENELLLSRGKERSKSRQAAFRNNSSEVFEANKKPGENIMTDEDSDFDNEDNDNSNDDIENMDDSDLSHRRNSKTKLQEEQIKVTKLQEEETKTTETQSLSNGKENKKSIVLERPKAPTPFKSLFGRPLEGPQNGVENPTNYDKQLEKYGWRMEIPGDPLNIKRPCIAKRRPVSVTLSTPNVSINPSGAINDRGCTETFFHCTSGGYKAMSFTIHPDWASEALSIRRLLGKEPPYDPNRRYADLSFTY